MSEESVVEYLEPKYNLCIPEDAFDKFQAVSMYEEKEIITLPRNVPPDPNIAHSDDNNVASSSASELNSPVSSTMVGDKIIQSNRSQSQTNTGLTEGNSILDDCDMVVSNSDNPNNPENTTEESLSNNVLPRKRGRKPKKSHASPVQDLTADTSQSIQNPDISSTPFCPHPEALGVKIVKRTRRRSKRPSTNEQADIESDIEKDLGVNSSNDKASSCAAKKPRTGGRSRSRRSRALSVNINADNKEHASVEKNELNEEQPLDINPVCITDSYKKVKKNKRKIAPLSSNLEKINSDNNKLFSDKESFDHNDADDICLSELRSTHVQSNISKLPEDNCPSVDKSYEKLNETCPDNADSQNKLPKKRRGRPKVKTAQAALSLSQHIEVLDPFSTEKYKTIDDEGDDISLSTLKSLADKDTILESKHATSKEGNDTKITDEKTVDHHPLSDKDCSFTTNIEDSSSEIQISNIEQSNIENNGTPLKRNTKMPVMADFEYNIDSVIGSDNAETKSQSNDGTISVEENSKRPVRRKVKKMQYEEESDEDPFANVELSDDEPMRGRRGNKYYSDDEYLPGKRDKTAIDSTDSEVSDSNLGTELENSRKHKKKKFHKKSDNPSPRKRGKKDRETTPKLSDKSPLEISTDQDQSFDIEKSLDSLSDMKSANNVTQHSQPLQQWGKCSEFENFIAKKIQGTSLKIKKVDSSTSSDSNKIEIPVIDPEAKKTIEMCTQTISVQTLSTSVQTVSPGHVPLKENVPLTPEQSEKACYFLNSIVQTTAEVGTLMIQKSQDFIKKKINTNHVTDTAAMDYCVKKSFLLFKLAKHNLRQMEEDLEKQYNEFLKANNLAKYKEEQKQILPTPKESNSDSDCEIVEVLSVPPKMKTTKKAKPEFNPKTVFLNKELSIKIAKKPNESKKLDIKGRHTVWINDTVMLKKVKPTQSFLAQDSRNKKPPDNFVTAKMVSDFFENYRHQRSLSICAPFVTTDWLTVNKECICNYFTVQPVKFNAENHSVTTNNSNFCETSNSVGHVMSLAKNKIIKSPESLFTLCFHILKTEMQQQLNKLQEIPYKRESEVTGEKKNPVTLFRLCMELINKAVTKRIIDSRTNQKLDQEIHYKIRSEVTVDKNMPLTLSQLCMEIINNTEQNKIMVSPPIYVPDQGICYSPPRVPDISDHVQQYVSVPTLKVLCFLSISCIFKSKPSNDVMQNTVKSLKSLCCKSNLETHPFQPELTFHNSFKIKSPKSLCLSLKSLCYKRMVELLEFSSDNNQFVKDLYSNIKSAPEKLYETWNVYSQENMTVNVLNKVESLLSICLKNIQKTFMNAEEHNNSILTPKSLQKIAFENLKALLFTNTVNDTNQCNNESAMPGLMINCVNTLSEEAFLNLEHCNGDIPDSSEYNDFDSENNFEPDMDSEDNVPETSWISQVQMQELRSGINVNNDVNEPQLSVTQIKVEPDDFTENYFESIAIKKEPIVGPDEMTIIPDVKSEIEEHIPTHRKVSNNSYSADEFENFLNCNKLMRPVIDENDEEIYSQCSNRILMQHEPDDCDVNNTDMLNLLVPHTYETMNVQTAKGSLMQSSSDESNKNTKNTAKKVKRTRAKIKKPDQKAKSDVPVLAPAVCKAKEKNATAEVAILTRRMKEKIRQEQKLDESTDSENENIGVRLRSRDKKDNSVQTKDKSKTLQDSEPIPMATKQSKKVMETSSKAIDPSIKNSAPSSTKQKHDNNELTDSSNVVPDTCNKEKNIEIQCNNVDSTEQFEENIDIFTGFTSIETNEMSNYEKCMKFVYERVIPRNSDDKGEHKPKFKDNMVNKQTKEYDAADKEPIISPDEPIELLQCEPSMPIFDDILEENVSLKKKGRLACPASKKNGKSAEDCVSCPYTDRHGWHCYPMDSDDPKLYQNASIYLEKLPESFVQTYFKYQNMTTNKNECDEEINRLTNLSSLNRSSNLKDRKPQNSQTQYKRQIKDIKSENITDDEMQTESAMDSDHYEQLMASDDESARVEDQIPQLVPQPTENNLAKSLLMTENDSEDEAGSKESVKIKTEDGHETKRHKKKMTIKVEDTENLMLTADKMMNKELTLLHAPVVLDDNAKESPSKGPVTRQLKKNTAKTSPTNTKKKTEEDSSSEEEKQWVSTKEKLLKRMGKKESASADDAKRAKLVSEFIERREGNPDAHVRLRTGKRSRRSAKKFLEREKQLRVLHRELFGEISTDPTLTKRSVAAWKGRRNIRKVLDKKSLARSTVVANMEEFERKKRLNGRQTKLRELLGCEEGVNVLVINDEVCLEYDFEENRPVVTIHPFFTKVMKAHQYEGVKFMWDACFESLSEIESGRPGGGCILAHCMGLGKTLQVLALLHTVLTHPGVGMRRVLVCCPLSTVLNWVDEIHKWIGPVTNQIKVFELSKLKKTYERAYQLEDWYNGGGIFIIGYELFRSLSTLDPFLDDVRPTIVNKIRTALLDPGPDIVVCDEGHLLKNDCSVLAVAMSRVVTKRRIVLTGTPMQNNLREYYCMVNFVKPNLLGTYSEYSNRFENPIMNGQHRDSSEEDIKLMKARTHILHKVLEGCLQRQEASVLYPYLPKKHEYTVFINLTQCQWDLYKHYLVNYSRQLKNNSILKDFHILQKIWSHPQVLHNFQTSAQENRNKIKLEKLEDDLATEDLKEDLKDSVATELWWLPYLDGGKMLETLESSNKFVVVFRILEECVALGDKVLIFSTSLICLNSLEYFLKKIKNWSLGQEYYRLDGSVPAEVRQKWCREFNAENNVHTKLFLVSTRAGCLGLNMTAANRVIIMDTSWNPAHDIQSIFRVYRFGQKKDCFIYRLVAMGTMEQKIYERSVTKQAVACRVVDEQQIDRHYNMAELTELYRYDEAGSSVAGGVAVGVRDVALLRVARDSSLHAVHEHDSLLRSSEQGLPEHERAAAWMQFQQEQADKQMENTHVAKIPKISLKRVQGQNYAKSVAIKRDNTEDASEDFVRPNETKPRRGRKSKVSSEALATPGPSQTNQYSEQITPDTPGPSQEMDPYGEENMVQKISEILVKHNFHNKKGGTDVVQLLANVKRIVKQGCMYPNDSTDVVTASIAEVLLAQNRVPSNSNEITSKTNHNAESPHPTVNETDLSVIIPEPVSMISSVSQANIKQEVIVPDKTSKRKKRTPAINRSDQTLLPAPSSQEPESILGFSHNDEEFLPDSRKKRRAAIAAEKQFDLLCNDVVINLDDSDTDFVPKLADRTEKPPKNKRRNNINAMISQADNENAKESIPSRITYVDSDNEISIQESAKQTVPESESQTKSVIRPGPKTYKEKIKQKCKEIRKEPKENVEDVPCRFQNEDLCDRTSGNDLTCPTVDSATDSADEAEEKTPSADKAEEQTPSADEAEEQTPLPLSLLTNKNFINIVAHTYLNGNPMLDADAATLAAKYSTLKALKEVEQTGKDIVSGPIYDIAVKVIGKNLFKKMQNTVVDDVECSSSIQVQDADVTIHLKDSSMQVEDMDLTIKLRDKKHAKRSHKSKESSRKKTSREKKSAVSSIVSTTSTTDIQCSSSRVVPVGMIQTAGSLPSSEFASSESILPHDDDDMLIISSDLPPSSIETTTSHIIMTGDAKILNAVQPPPIYLDHSSTVCNTVPKPVSNIKAKGKVRKHTSVANASSTQTKKAPSQPLLPPTPNLSSETICLDSDDEDMSLTPAPLPQTHGIPVSTQDITPQVIMPSNQVKAGSPLVLRQISVCSPSKFILVPVKNNSLVNISTESITTESPAITDQISATPIKQSTKTQSSATPITQYLDLTTAQCSATPTKQISATPTKQISATPTKQISATPTNQVAATSNKQISAIPTNQIAATSNKQISATPSKRKSTTPNILRSSSKAKTILSTTLPSAGCMSKIASTAKCKPGDIIKITDNGQIEILHKRTAKPTISVSEVMKTVSNEIANKVVCVQPEQESSKLSDVDITSAPDTKSKDSLKNQRPFETSKSHTKTLPSNSSGCRSVSPVDNNPLSILKDVVHIQALEDKAESSREKKTSSTSHKSNVSNIFVKHKSETKISAKTADKRSKDSMIKKQQDSILCDKDNKFLKDLLNKKSTKPLAKIVNSAKDGFKSEPSTSNNKSFETIDLVALGTVKSGSGASMLTTKIEIRKRGSTSESNPTKKMKTGPMTLKDFNIDDIDDLDDIIELE